jgi:two-component system phosphate regulon sensor histidine kinase PhoR
VGVYRYRAEREGVALTLDVEAGLPAARIDERAIQLAVINLIDNALKYAPDGKEIAIRTVREGAVVAVRITDQGPGVPESDRDRIFERFVRGSHAPPQPSPPLADGASAGAGAGGRTRSPIRGSGIGLALVKHIAESHGGRAWVEGASGRAPPGSTFVFTIPASA